MQRGLLEHLRDFMLELGVGFAFVGSQYHLEVAEKDYYIDLLFYHMGLRAFVVIDLKVEEFKPEFAGKMNFYLSAVDDLLRHADDQSSMASFFAGSREGDRGICLARHEEADWRFGVSPYQGPAGGAKIEPAQHRTVGRRVDGRQTGPI